MKSEAPGSLELHAACPAWATWTATFFGIGRLRPGPGTWASAATAGLWWLLGWLLASRISLPWQILITFAAAVLATAVGIPAASRVAVAANLKDPQFVVIDEVAGQLIALLGAPVKWQSVLCGFILFRVFDILKPPPLRALERLRGGFGIVLDDIGAGLYALGVMRLLLYFAILPR